MSGHAKMRDVTLVNTVEGLVSIQCRYSALWVVIVMSFEQSSQVYGTIEILSTV